MLKKIILNICLACTLLGTASAAEPNSAPTLAGGYQTISTIDQGVQDAAQFAVAQINQGSLSAVLSAQSQVVAGINYKLLLEIESADGTNHTFDVIVFVPLPSDNQPMQLTSYQDLGPVISQPK